MSCRKDFLSLFLLIASYAFMIGTSWSQSYSRLSDPQYMQTKLAESFDAQTLNRDIWRVLTNMKKDNLYIFADTSATVNQTGEGLELTMMSYPGFTSKTWSPEGEITIEADFITGEVMTNEVFTYGVFECLATFAHERGSFPAFWLYSDAMCTETERPEIDIVELKVNRRNPTLDNNIWYYPLNCLPQTYHEFEQHPFTWGGTHLFKCVWTPDRIEFWVDQTILKTVENTGQYWYPKLPQHVVLSQQVVRYGRINRRSETIVTPQTSYFHWVRAREFFLAPEIVCPDEINKPEIALLDVDSAASEITWELYPGELFSGQTTGHGSKVEIVPAAGGHGTGAIFFRFRMPSGESFYAKKELLLDGLSLAVP